MPAKFPAPIKERQQITEWEGGREGRGEGRRERERREGRKGPGATAGMTKFRQFPGFLCKGQGSGPEMHNPITTRRQTGKTGPAGRAQVASRRS